MHEYEYTPWVPHLSFEQHWEERKVYLLDESNKRLLERQDNTQRLIALFAFIAIVVAILVPVCATRGTTTMEINGVVPVVVATPSVQSTATSQPSAESGLAK